MPDPQPPGGSARQHARLHGAGRPVGLPKGPHQRAQPSRPDGHRRPARLAVEPGRFLVARSGWLVSSVLHVRERGGRRMVVLDTGTYWSPFGLVVIAALIQLGGFGIMAGSTLLLFLFLRRRTTLRDRVLVQESLGGLQLGTVTTLVKGAGTTSHRAATCPGISPDA